MKKLRTGARVRIRSNVDFVFPRFRGRLATVKDTKELGTPRRLWAWLALDDGGNTWLPAERLEEVGEATP